MSIRNKYQPLKVPLDVYIPQLGITYKEFAVKYFMDIQNSIREGELRPEELKAFEDIVNVFNNDGMKIPEYDWGILIHAGLISTARSITGIYPQSSSRKLTRR